MDTQLQLLSTIAKNQPQTVYLAFVSEFGSKLNYFKRTIPEISHCLVPLEQTLQNSYIPGDISNDTERKPMSLPTRFGGLAIPFFMSKPK